MTQSRIERLCGLVILSSVLGACTGAGRIPTTATPDEAALTTARGSTSSSPRVTANPATSTPAGGRSGSADAAPFCAVALPGSWEAAKTTETENVVAMSTTGSVRWAAPELSWVAPGSHTHIANVPAPGLGSAWLVGHHVAYQRLRSDENWGDWELYLWDSTRQGRPVKLDESDGQVPNAPFLLVATSGDALVWLHPLKDGRREVRLHQVAACRTTVVHVGHLGTPLVAGDLLIWPEASAVDASPGLVAVDLRTLEPVPLPGPLAELRDPQEMSSDGRTFAWASADRRRLLAWQRGWPAARVVTETEEGTPGHVAQGQRRHRLLGRRPDLHRRPTFWLLRAHDQAVGRRRGVGRPVPAHRCPGGLGRRLPPGHLHAATSPRLPLKPTRLPDPFEPDTHRSGARS